MNSEDKNNLRDILKGAAAFLIGALIYFSLILVIRWQADFGMRSETAIEWMQDAVIAVCMAVFYALAARLPKERGGLLLIAGFMTAIFIREQDGYLDCFGHSAWQFAMVAFLVPLFFYVWKRGLSETLHGLAVFVRSRAFYTMAAGVGMFLVYSRLYGSEHWVWSLFLDKAHGMYTAKRLSEESTELLGYTLMMISSLGYLRDRMREKISGK